MDLRDPAQRAAFETFLRDQYGRVEQATYYEILGLTPAATVAQVRDNYYKLAARYHPDLFGTHLAADAKQLLVTLYARIVEAYQTLSNGGRRALYDKNLLAGKLRYTSDDERAELANQQRAREPVFKNPATKRFYQLAAEAMRSHDLKSALFNLKMALGVEPMHLTLREELARVEAALKAAGQP